MATKAELEQKIAELEAKLAEAGQNTSNVLTPAPGEQYYTSWGICTVKQVFIEDGIEKIQGEWLAFSKADFETAEGEPELKTMTLERFLTGYYEYPAFKRQRMAEIQKGAK